MPARQMYALSLFRILAGLWSVGEIFSINVAKTISASSIHNASSQEAFHADSDYLKKLVESMVRRLQGVIERG